MDDSLKIKLIKEYASQYNIDVSNCETLRDYQNQLENAFETNDNLDRHTEIEVKIDASFLVGFDADSLTWDGWPETVDRRITMNVADDGFERAGTVEDITLNDVFDW